MWWTLPVVACLGLGWRAGDPRPSLSGPEQVLSAGGFDLHYTLEGEDAVQGAIGQDGVPELVHEALDALAFGEQRYLDRGYRALVGDGGGGGTEAIDVYMRSLDANGYATPIPLGDEGASCYMQLDGSLTVPGVMRSVAVHELHHCVEYRYTAGTQGWIYEATATYEQYSAYLDPRLEAAVVVLWQRRLQAPEQPMDRDDGSFEYAGMVPMLFWEQYQGADPLRLPDLWEALAVEPGWRDAFDTEARRVFGRPWDEVFLEYATWNAFACANDDGAHYDDAVLACNDVVSVPIEPLVWDGDEVLYEVRLPKTPYAAAYFELPDAEPEREIHLDCADPRNREGVLLNQLVAVGSEGAAGASAWGPAGDGAEPVVLGAGRPSGGSLLVVAASVGDGGVVSTCRLRSVVPVPEDQAGCGCDAAPRPAGWAWLIAGLWLSRRGRRPRSTPRSG